MRAFAKVTRGRPKRMVADHQAANDNEHRDGARDHGTPELRMKRAQLARGLDPAQCSHPLDLLLAKEWIAAAEHRAGWRYAALYRHVIGRTDVSYGRFYDGIAGDGIAGTRGGLATAVDENDLAEMTRRFHRAKRDLLRAGLLVARVTEQVGVFGAWPDWILAADGSGAVNDCRFLRTGLRALGDSFAGGCR